MYETGSPDEEPVAVVIGFWFNISVLATSVFTRLQSFHLSPLTASVRLNLLTLAVQLASKLALRSLNRSFPLSPLTTLRVIEPLLRSLRLKINFHSLACTSFHFSPFRFNLSALNIHHSLLGRSQHDSQFRPTS